MNDKVVYDEPSDVTAEDGIVLLKGPDSVHVRLTPDAAEQTSDRIMENVLKARGQRYFSAGGNE